MTFRSLSRLILAAAFLVAGLLHLLVPAPFLAITPDWVPLAPIVIAVTGVAELAGSVGLLVPRLRWAAGIGLAAYAICVYPANIQHTISDLSLAHPHLGWAYHGPRLAFQPVIVWLALWSSQVIDWPFRRSQPT